VEEANDIASGDPTVLEPAEALKRSSRLEVPHVAGRPFSENVEDTLDALANGGYVAEGEGRRQESNDFLIFGGRKAMDEFKGIRREIARTVAISEGVQSLFCSLDAVRVIELLGFSRIH
jgi:hypothetical protein